MTDYKGNEMFMVQAYDAIWGWKGGYDVTGIGSHDSDSH